MAVQLPLTFVDIPTAKSMNHATINAIAVVTDALPPKQTGGSSLVSTFTLMSSDFSSDYWNGLKVRYFHDQQQYVPAPNVGDVVLLRNLNLRIYQGAVIGISTTTDATPWIIFKKDSKQHSGFSSISWPGAGAPSYAETKYVQHLLRLYAGEKSSTIVTSSSVVNNVRRVESISRPIQHTGASKSGKFRLIKDAEYSTFVDILGQVVKTFSEYERFNIYITDYTQNKDLFDYSFDGEGRDGDEYSYISRPKRKWPGPYGRMTLQVTLWEPHADFARNNVKEDDFIWLRNVNIKLGRGSGVMEGALHTSRQYPSAIDVELVDDSKPDTRFRELMQRKLEYWRKIKGRLPKDDSKRPLSDGEATSTKMKKNKKQKKNKPSKQNVPVKVTTSIRPKRDELNSHIRSNYIATPTRTIKQILENESHWNTGPGGIEYQLPFQNLKYRASVRVVDFFPPNLEDFAVPFNPEYAILADTAASSDLIDSDEEPIIGRQRWEWRFCLLVEDGGPGVHHAPGQKRERLKLFVTGPDAEFLLSIDPVNLREHSDVLDKLREKLFILWGDLQERKTSNPESFNPNDSKSINAKPFICCIKEYGVRVAAEAELGSHGTDEETSDSFGWERRFRMFDTGIM
ncbi:hypothetical protein PRK78_005744 [Emydomyces testavorans]|uniref:Protection of telomeres protein 1 n=1 Tax=Emydomyces testavorans TaxID=2070801 RepID=A0AAF0DL52_9EURO|nr:hypothetical protein PRK78_005744 [Emydomyces testavorans]